MEASQITPAPSDPVAAAAEVLLATQASITLSAAGSPGAELPQTRFPRLSLARRVLGYISEEVDETAFGARNTLAALTRGLSMDAHTTSPQNPECEKLDVSGTLKDTVAIVFGELEKLVEAGLAEYRKDGSYHVTADGRAELAS